MGLDPQLPRAELLAVYQENSDYDLVESLPKARLFIQACRNLLAVPVKRSASGGRGGEEVELDTTEFAAALQRAEKWYHARRGADLDPRQFVPGDDFRG